MADFLQGLPYAFPELPPLSYCQVSWTLLCQRFGTTKGFFFQLYVQNLLDVCNLISVY